MSDVIILNIVEDGENVHDVELVLALCQEEWASCYEKRREQILFL